MLGTSGRSLVNVAGKEPSTRIERGWHPANCSRAPPAACGSLWLILARESPALRLVNVHVHVHSPKAGFAVSEP
jgi:hypothetical protein